MRTNYIVEYLKGGNDAKVRIIIAALGEFASRSLDGARTREIAKRAGVNHAAISYHFGGKNELYMELVREISEYILIYSEPYFKRAENILKTRNASAAKQFIFDYNMSRISCDKNIDKAIFRDVILLISREEMYPSAAFDLFFKAFKRINEVMANMVGVASCGKLDGVKAKIVAEMIMGQIHVFVSAREGFMRNNGWKGFVEREVESVRRSFLFMLDKIFKR